jgi:hypothetical protein
MEVLKEYQVAHGINGKAGKPGWRKGWDWNFSGALGNRKAWMIILQMIIPGINQFNIPSIPGSHV